MVCVIPNVQVGLQYTTRALEIFGLTDKVYWSLCALPYLFHENMAYDES